jgi:hypothetical protein
MCLQFGFLIFWPKDFGAKAGHKMLVKLTPGGCMGPNYVWQVLFSEKHKIAKKQLPKHMEKLSQIWNP